MRKLLLAMFLAVAAPSVAVAEIQYPDAKAPLSTFTASQQWMPDSNRWELSDYGYGTLAGSQLFADEMGDKFSEMGRGALIYTCFRNKDKVEEAILEWALCGTDVRQFDMKKFQKEMADAKLSKEDQADILESLNKWYEPAKTYVAQLDGEAKSDKGLQLLATLVENSKKDWASYISAHKADYDLYLKLKDGVRSGKTSNPVFQGCFEAIKPAWDKYVPLANKKIPLDVDGDPAVAYMGYLGNNIEGYVLATSFAACAWSNSEEGEAPYAAIAATEYGSRIHGGWRTHALSKLLDENLGAKFSDRSYKMEKFQWNYGVSVPTVERRMAIMTPSWGVIDKIVDNKDGSSKVTFKKDKVEACLQWADSNRIRSISSSGSVSYERTCLKRGLISNQSSPVNVPTRYVGGAKSGQSITIVRGFPIVAWQGKKVTMIFGAAIK